MDENLDKILEQVLANSKKLKTGIPDEVFEEILDLQFRYQEDPVTARKQIEKAVERYLNNLEGGK